MSQATQPSFPEEASSADGRNRVDPFDDVYVYMSAQIKRKNAALQSRLETLVDGHAPSEDQELPYPFEAGELESPWNAEDHVDEDQVRESAEPFLSELQFCDLAAPQSAHEPGTRLDRAEQGLPFTHLLIRATSEKRTQDLPKLPWETGIWQLKLSSSLPHVGFTDTMLPACPVPTNSGAIVGKSYPGFMERRLKLGGISKATEESVRANCLQKMRSMTLILRPRSWEQRW